REPSGLRRGFRADRPCALPICRWPERDRGRDHVRAPRRRGRGDEWRVRRGRRHQDSASGPGTPVTLFDALSGQRRFVYLLVALLGIAGVWAASILPSATYPELNSARVTIVATGTALGPRQQRFSVSPPIQEAVTILPGATRAGRRARGRARQRRARDRGRRRPGAPGAADDDVRRPRGCDPRRHDRDRGWAHAA